MKTLGPLLLLLVVVVLVLTFDSTTVLIDFRISVLVISVFQNSKAFLIKPGGLSLHRP